MTMDYYEPEDVIIEDDYFEHYESETDEDGWRDEYAQWRSYYD